MLLVRGALAVALILCGGAIVVRMLAFIRPGGFAILPGLVLGGAMIALGVHRLALIAHARRAA